MTGNAPAGGTAAARLAARGRRWLLARPLAADPLLALALFVTQLGWWAATPRMLWEVSLPAVMALSAGEMLFVAVRRRWTWLATVGISAYSVAAVLLLPAAEAGGGGLGFLAVAYTAAAYLRLRPAVAATAVLWVPAVVLSALPDQRPPSLAEVPWWFYLTFTVLLALICFFVGRVVHTRRAYVAALEERAAAAEANQRALADNAVSDERRRIARELHDLVAHHVAVMGVLATGARRAAGRDPVAADQALATIEETGRTVLREMRRLLQVLRSDSEPAMPERLGAEDSELAPQPTLAAVKTLVEQVHDAGLPVALQVEGDPEPLDPGVALTVYRVVQEALTNVLKHGGPAATAQVRIVRRGAWLRLEVFDTGWGAVPGGDGVGHGLVSMRERVHLLGGTLRVGPRPGGGFRVYATIPTDQLAELP
jgi:signal transduction histidine kinase